MSLVILLYENKDHQPNIKREPNMLQNRLSALSKNKSMFNKYKEPYEKALKSSGFNKTLEYSNQKDDMADRKRRKSKYYTTTPI